MQNSKLTKYLLGQQREMEIRTRKRAKVMPKIATDSIHYIGRQR
jgi:hypothetical protein